MIERTDSNVAIERIFEEAYNMISEASHVPLTDKVMLDESEFVGLLDDLKEAIPKEIKSATQVLEEQKNIVNKAYFEADKIVEQAKSEAERIVGSARAQADEMVKEQEIVAQANAVAEDIKNNALRYRQETCAEADEYALKIKQDALRYVDDMLKYIGNNMQTAAQSIAENHDSINRELQGLYAAPAVEYNEELQQEEE